MASLPRIGETISGFTVTELGTIHMLGARTVLFNHELSGAQLLYIQNDDRELGFNLIYRTPQLDERDSSHILEHLILSSCQKYPSRDIFFDMDSKSYTTFRTVLRTIPSPAIRCAARAGAASKTDGRVPVLHGRAGMP